MQQQLRRIQHDAPIDDPLAARRFSNPDCKEENKTSHFQWLDKSETSESDFPPLPEDAEAKVEAGPSLDDGSETNSCRFISLDTVAHPIDRSFAPTTPAMMKIESGDIADHPELLKAPITQQARRKRGGKKKHF